MSPVYLLVKSILKIMVHLQVSYSQLEDQQVAPPTLSLFWRQRGLFLLAPFYADQINTCDATKKIIKQ